MLATSWKLTFLLFVMSSLGLAQTADGTLTGQITDAHGDIIAGAKVRLTAGAAGFTHGADTNAEGHFGFTGLARGSYRIEVSASGFATFERQIEIPYAGELPIKLDPALVAEHVSVTSSYLAGTKESLDEIPGSIERIDAQTLENARVYNFSEALRKFSGVNVRDEEGFGLRPNIGIRGTNPTRSTKILLLEDGLPLSYAPYGDNSSYYHPPIERYESIEVLKGSGQIAYGPHTIGGVVNYLTPQPPQARTTNVRFETGSRRFLNGGLGYGDTIGRLGFITNYNHKRGNGSRENTSFRLNDFAGKATFALSDRQLLTGKFTLYREDSNLTYTGATGPEFAANPRGNIFKNDFFDGRRVGFSLQHAAVVSSNINIVTNFYANQFSRDWWRQTSNSGERPFRLYRPADPLNPISDFDCRSLSDLNTTCGNRGNLRDYLTTGIEPRLNAQFHLGEIRNELNVGVRIHFERQSRLAKFGDMPTARDGFLAEDNQREVTAYSGFVQNRFVWNDFAVTPGVRVEKIEFRRLNRLAGGGAGKTALTQVVPGVGVAYSPGRRTTLFAGLHRGFAPPRVEDVITDAGGLRDLASELSWNYEAGIRTRPFQGLDFSSTIFRNAYENQIVAASIASGTQFTNGGRTLQQGLEVTGAVDFGPIFSSHHNFYVRTAHTFLPTAEFRGDRLSSVTSSATLNTYCPMGRRFSASACIITGNRLPYAPGTLMTTSVGYSNRSGSDAFVERVFIGRQFGDDLNAVNPSTNGQLGAIASQTYWNATVNYRVERWRTSFFVTAKNIFDRLFIVDLSRGILPSGPRLFQTGVNVRF